MGLPGWGDLTGLLVMLCRLNRWLADALVVMGAWHLDARAGAPGMAVDIYKTPGNACNGLPRCWYDAACGAVSLFYLIGVVGYMSASLWGMAFISVPSVA